MSHPDSTAAFDADASRTDDVATLKARLAELENTPATEVEIIDPNDTTELSKVNTATIAGEEWHFHTPKSQALMAFGLGTADRRNGQRTMGAMHRFIGFHLLEEDYDHLLDRMSDPTDKFGDDEFGDLLNKIIEAASTSAESNAPKTGPAWR